MEIEDVKIVIADDRRSIRMMLGALFNNLGVPKHNIREAANGREALDLVDKDAPHLVWTDNSMPIMTGLQMVWALRTKEAAEKQGKRIVIVMASARDCSIEAEAAGADRFLMKPFPMEKVEAAINELVLKKQAPAPVTAPLNLPEQRL